MGYTKYLDKSLSVRFKYVIPSVDVMYSGLTEA